MKKNGKVALQHLADGIEQSRKKVLKKMKITLEKFG